MIGELCCGCDRRSRVLHRVFLLDGDGRKNAFDLIDVRPIDALEELPHIRRHRFDESSLSLGVESVERKRRFARSGRPSQYRELALRNLDVDVLEVVRTRAAYGDRSIR